MESALFWVFSVGIIAYILEHLKIGSFERVSGERASIRYLMHQHCNIIMPKEEFGPSPPG